MILKKILLKLIKNRFSYLLFTLLYENYHQERTKALRKKYDIPESFHFNGENITFYGDGKIICGENSYIGWYSSVQSGDGYYVKIGEHTSIAPNVRMYTNSAEADQDMALKGTSDFVDKCGNIEIGDNVWIGANTFILSGMKIGNNVVVGANSVVTRSLPDNTICGGSPAKILKFKSYISSNDKANIIRTHCNVLHKKLLDD